MSFCQHVNDVNVVRPGVPVHKDECCLCFDGRDLTSSTPHNPQHLVAQELLSTKKNFPTLGHNVCLVCFTGGCFSHGHMVRHYEVTKHHIVLNICKKTDQQVDKNDDEDLVIPTNQQHEQIASSTNQQQVTTLEELAKLTATQTASPEDFVYTGYCITCDQRYPIDLNADVDNTNNKIFQSLQSILATPKQDALKLEEFALDQGAAAGGGFDLAGSVLECQHVHDIAEHHEECGAINLSMVVNGEDMMDSTMDKIDETIDTNANNNNQKKEQYYIFAADGETKVYLNDFNGLPDLKYATKPDNNTTGSTTTPAQCNIYKCQDCDIKTNLWLCLSCGYLGCGRKEYDGSGGNNHAVEHHNATEHCVVVKIATVTNNTADGDNNKNTLSGDLWCYKCNDAVTDTQLDEHLKVFNINTKALTQSEKSMEQMQLEYNIAAQFSSVYNERGVENPLLFGGFHTGITNFGNSCYLSSVAQLFFRVPLIFQRYYLYGYHQHIATCRNGRPAQCVLCTMYKVCFGLFSGEYNNLPKKQILYNYLQKSLKTINTIRQEQQQQQVDSTSPGAASGNKRKQLQHKSEKARELLLAQQQGNDNNNDTAMTDNDLSLQVTNTTTTIGQDGNIIDPLATPITPGVPQHIAKRAKLSQDDELDAEGDLHAPINNDMTMGDQQQEQNNTTINPNEKVCLTPSSNNNTDTTTTNTKAATAVDVEVDKPITLQKGITIHTLRKMLNNKHPVFGNHTQQDAHEFLGHFRDYLHSFEKDKCMQQYKLANDNLKFFENLKLKNNNNNQQQESTTTTTTPFEPKILDPFTFKTQQVLECIICQHKQLKFTNQYDLGLNLPIPCDYNAETSGVAINKDKKDHENKKDTGDDDNKMTAEEHKKDLIKKSIDSVEITKCLKDYTTTTIAEGYKCTKCNSLNSTQSTTQLTTAPQYLTLQLRRFILDKTTWSIGKNIINVLQPQSSSSSSLEDNNNIELDLIDIGVVNTTIPNVQTLGIDENDNKQNQTTNNNDDSDITEETKNIALMIQEMTMAPLCLIIKCLKQSRNDPDMATELVFSQDEVDHLNNCNCPEKIEERNNNNNNTNDDDLLKQQQQNNNNNDKKTINPFEQPVGAFDKPYFTSQQEQEQNNNKNNNNKNKAKYKLIGFINHLGTSPNNGHYVTHISSQWNNQLIQLKQQFDHTYGSIGAFCGHRSGNVTPDLNISQFTPMNYLSTQSTNNNNNNNNSTMNDNDNNNNNNVDSTTTVTKQIDECIIKNQLPTNHNNDNTWICYNDDKVFINNEPPIETAYILLYQRID